MKLLQEIMVDYWLVVGDLTNWINQAVGKKRIRLKSDEIWWDEVRANYVYKDYSVTKHGTHMSELEVSELIKIAHYLKHINKGK